MNFLRNIFGGGKPREAGDGDALWLYVKCNKCGAPLSVRIDRRNELSRDYDKGGMWVRKEMMDSSCFQLMFAEVHLGENGQVLERKIDRGQFLTEQEYEALKQEWEARKQAGGK